MTTVIDPYKFYERDLPFDQALLNRNLDIDLYPSTKSRILCLGTHIVYMNGIES